MVAQNKPGVWFEAESDNDMVAEISTRLEDAAEKGVDESDVYGLMLEQGINVEMVRKYMGDAAANHMQEYCEEHGVV